MSDAKHAKPKQKGRPPLSDRKIGQMRTSIAAAARSLFKNEGFEAVSMRRLAQAVGCTPMSIYTYYDSKIDVLRTLWAEVFEDLFAKLTTHTPIDISPTARLHSICLTYVQYWLDHREDYRLVFMSAGVDQPDVSVFVESSQIANEYAIFVGVLADATKRPINEIAVTCQALICAMNGIAHCLITISDYPWEAPNQLVNAIVEGALLSAQSRA